MLAFCEPLPATTVSKEHVRVVGPEGLMLGGGAPGETLCGRPLRSGWDLPTPVTSEALAAGTTPDSDGRVFVCTGCAEAAVVAVSGRGGETK